LPPSQQGHVGRLFAVNADVAEMLAVLALRKFQYDSIGFCFKDDMKTEPYSEDSLTGSMPEIQGRVARV
jgi:hypothetical protein